MLVTAGLNAALAYATGVAARRRGDRRVHLVSLAFLAASGFLALHALATPGVLLDRPNLGFVLATPLGLVIAGAFAAASALEVDWVRPVRLQQLLLAAMAVWLVVSLTLLPGPGRLGCARADVLAARCPLGRRGRPVRLRSRPIPRALA